MDHSLRCPHIGLAPRLIGRFENGLLYRFVPGTTCKTEDIRKPDVSRAIAKELGQWHSRLPLSALTSISSKDETGLHVQEPKLSTLRPYPNVWTTMQRWLDDLPADSEEEKERNQLLQKELSALCNEFTDAPGLCGKDYVFIHGDLHDANIIIRESLPISCIAGSNESEAELKVDFIDYEYCMPAPPAFELAYHFSEWAGFDCDYDFIPTRAQRLCFLESYVTAFYQNVTECSGRDLAGDIAYLHGQVDQFRGVPGFYWGLWALMQIHRTGEDHNSFYETKIKEYWDWKAEVDGSREKNEKEISLRERRWMED
jgi:ethanolamine kinase